MKRAATLDDLIKRGMKDKEFKALFEKELFINKVANLVHDLRKKKGLTQEQLAKRIGTKQPVIARLEGGRDSRIPSLDLLNKLAYGLGAHLVISFEQNKRKLFSVRV